MAINFNEDNSGILSVDTGNNYDQMTFNPGSLKDTLIKNLYNIEKDTGFSNPQLDKLKQEDMQQFKDKGIPLSLPSDAYTAMAIANYDDLFGPKTITDALGTIRTTSGFAKPDINTLPFNVNEVTSDGITNNNRFKNMLLDIKDKGVDKLGSGKDLVLRGIGSVIGGPVGSLIGSLIGGIKESPTDKVGLTSFGGDYDPYGFKGQLTSGTLGARQDPFGRNIVSAFGNYEQNRINELKELTRLQNLGLLNNKMKQSKLDFAKNYLEKVKQEREQRQREAARRNFADVYRRADQQGFTGPGGGFDTSAADKAGTSLGSGQFSPSSSRGRSGY